MEFINTKLKSLSVENLDEVICKCEELKEKIIVKNAEKEAIKEFSKSHEETPWKYITLEDWTYEGIHYAFSLDVWFKYKNNDIRIFYQNHDCECEYEVEYEGSEKITSIDVEYIVEIMHQICTLIICHYHADMYEYVLELCKNM